MIVWGAGSGGSLSVAYRKAGRDGKSFVRDAWIRQRFCHFQLLPVIPSPPGEGRVRVLDEVENEQANYKKENYSSHCCLSIAFLLLTIHHLRFTAFDLFTIHDSRFTSSSTGRQHSSSGVEHKAFAALQD